MSKPKKLNPVYISFLVISLVLVGCFNSNQLTVTPETEQNSSATLVFQDETPSRDWENQSHHYAAIFFLAYFGTQDVASVVNYARDSVFRPNPGDANLGEAAATDGAAFHSMFPRDLADLIRDLGMRSP